MLEIRNKLLNGLYHLRLGKVLLLEDAFQLVEEPIHLCHFMASGLADYTQGCEALHINLLPRHIELFVGFFACGVALEVHRWVLRKWRF